MGLDHKYIITEDTRDNIKLLKQIGIALFMFTYNDSDINLII